MALLLVGAVVLLAARGWSFYVLGLDQRPDHPDFRRLRPSGIVGNGYGFAGALLVFANLLYLARRRLAWFQVGSMRLWLDLHVFTGLLAAVFVAFHSAFQLRTPIATVTALSLAVVVLTGAVGRLLHAIVPRPDERRLGDALAALDAELPGTRVPVLAAIDAFPPPELAANASLVRCLAALPAWRRATRDRREGVELVVYAQSRFKAADRDGRRRLDGLVRAVQRAAVADVRASSAAALLRSWRSLHRLFAILMLLAVVVHVGVAWHYGYRWIFSD